MDTLDTFSFNVVDKFALAKLKWNGFQQHSKEHFIG